MQVQKSCVLLISFVSAMFFSLHGADMSAVRESDRAVPKNSATKIATYTLKNDIAFVSVWGSRPESKKLQGFQHAVLFNARGEVMKKIDIGRDSIYSLDKMIQENKTRGPLFIRMYR